MIALATREWSVGAGIARLHSCELNRQLAGLAGPSVVADAVADWKPAPRWDRSSGLTTAATRNQPRCGALDGLPYYAWRSSVAAAAGTTAPSRMEQPVDVGGALLQLFLERAPGQRSRWLPLPEGKRRQRTG
jgi:hypothetical protein